MIGIENMWVFVFAGILLNILPGPDSLYVIGRSASQGFKAGSAASFGIAAGILIHVLAAAFGLSAILASSSAAFALVKIVGCLYLIYLGISMFFRAKNSKAAQSGNRTDDSLRTVFYQGFLTNVLNPKVALFFLAFVPQFISLDAPNKAIAFIILGLIFNFNGMIWCHLLAWSSSSLSLKFRHNARLAVWSNRAAGSLFVYFGIRLAIGESS